MNKRSHIIFGIILAIAFILLLWYLELDLIKFSFSSVIILMGITIFYSLLPDIDHKNSTITWWFFGLGILGLIVGIIDLKFNFFDSVNSLMIIIFSTVLLAVTFISVQIFHHRGFTHSVPAGLIAVTPVFLLFHNIFFCIMAYVAWHSHLIADGYIFKLK